MDQKHIHREEAQHKTEENDLDLIIRFQQGEIAAFNLLIQRYQDHVYTYVHENVSDKTVVLDIVRAIFVQAYQRLPCFHGEKSVKTWLLQLAEQHLQKKVSMNAPSWLTRFLSPIGKRCVDAPNGSEATDVHEVPEACQQIRTHFVAYLEGDLPDADAQLVTTHLRTCAVCAEDFEQLVGTVELLQAAGTLQAPVELRVLIGADLERLRQSFWQRMFQRFPVSLPRLTTLTASVAILFALIVSYQNAQLRRQLDQQRQSIGNNSQFTFDSAPATKDTVVILTGPRLPDDPLKDTRTLADILRITPQQTEFITTTNDFDAVGQLISTKIPMLEGNIRENTMEQKPPLIIRRIIADVPENFTAILASSLHHLEPAGSERPPFTTMTVRLFIITKP